MTRGDSFLNDESFARARDLIYDLTGIRYADSRRYLLDTRIRSRAHARGFQDGGGYLDFLSSSPEREGEIDALIDQITTNETSFFRHRKQIDVLQEITADLIEARRRRGDRRLRMWSAACSSGEEPYTLAMVVAEALQGNSGWDVVIRGTDISPAEIGRARRGQYTNRQLAGVPEAYMARYTRQDPADPQHRLLAPSVMRMVQFDVGSLLDAAVMRSAAGMDVVFCRNVLIYFDHDSKKKVLDGIWQCLAPGGHLVLGPAESLHGISDAFQRTVHSAHNCYIRPLEPAAATAPPTAAPSASRASSVAPDRTSPTSPAPTAFATPSSDERPAPQTLRQKMLVSRMDMGLRDLQRDVGGSLDKVVDLLTGISDSLTQARESREWSQSLVSDLAAASRQLARALIFLQVTDRSQQKLEALRATLQELSDRTLGGQSGAPDLRVRSMTFNTEILTAPEEADETQQPEATETGEEAEALSQDDIDALFN